MFKKNKSHEQNGHPQIVLPESHTILKEIIIIENELMRIKTKIRNLDIFCLTIITLTTIVSFHDHFQIIMEFIKKCLS